MSFRFPAANSLGRTAKPKGRWGNAPDCLHKRWKTATHSLSLQLFILKAALEQHNCWAEGTGPFHALLSPFPWSAFPPRGFICSNWWTCVKVLSPRAQFTLGCQQFLPPESAFCFYYTLPSIRHSSYLTLPERDLSKSKWTVQYLHNFLSCFKITFFQYWFDHFFQSKRIYNFPDEKLYPRGQTWG